MLGLDTLVMTKKGFKKIGDLQLYDEVLTGYGVFEPIIKLGPIKKMEKCVVLSTLEKIYCSDNLIWNTLDTSAFKNEEGARRILFTDELIPGKTGCCDIYEHKFRSKKPLMPAYDYAVVVPMGVPYEYLMAGHETRSKFVAGLIDSPICEDGMLKGTYNFYTNYVNLAIEMVPLFRTFGWGVDITYIAEFRVYCVQVRIGNNFDYNFVKDDYKRVGEVGSYHKYVRIMSVTDLEEDGNDIYGREVCVNGGMLLIGYSLMPVQ